MHRAWGPGGPASGLEGMGVLVWGIIVVQSCSAFLEVRAQTRHQL